MPRNLFEMGLPPFRGAVRQIIIASVAIYVVILLLMSFAQGVGQTLLALGILITVANFFWSRRFGGLAGPDPWGGDTLEWATSSPPPPYDFVEIPKFVEKLRAGFIPRLSNRLLQFFRQHSRDAPEVTEKSKLRKNRRAC